MNASASLLAFNANARGLRHRPSNGRRRPYHVLGIRAHPSRHDRPNRPDIHGPNSRGGPSSRAGPRRNSSRPNSRSSVTPMVPTTRASRSTDTRRGNTQVRRRRARLVRYRCSSMQSHLRRTHRSRLRRSSRRDIAAAAPPALRRTERSRRARSSSNRTKLRTVPPPQRRRPRATLHPAFS